jgi:hypothetical protein
LLNNHFGPVGSNNAELVIGSTLFLMSSYARGTQPSQLGIIICRHLESLADRDDLSSVLRQLCDQLAVEWQTAPQKNPSSKVQLADTAKRKPWFKLVPNS